MRDGHGYAGAIAKLQVGAVAYSIAALVGTWRSLVAHLHGVQGVASSNLAVPTNPSLPAFVTLAALAIAPARIRPTGMLP